MKIHKYNGSFCLLDEAYDNGFTFHEYKTLEDAMDLDMASYDECEVEAYEFLVEIGYKVIGWEDQ